MSGFSPEEGDRQHRTGSNTHHLSGVAINPTRNIDGHHIVTGHGLHQSGGQPVQRTGQPGPEESVDHKQGVIGTGQRSKYGRGAIRYTGGIMRHDLKRAMPMTCCIGGIARQTGGITQQGDLYRPARLRQQSGNDKAVTTIIAGAAEHPDPAGRPAPRAFPGG